MPTALVWTPQLMNPMMMSCAALFGLVLLLTAVAVGADTPHTYQPGRITGWSTQHGTVTGAATGKSIATHKQVFNLKGTDAAYEIDDCGTFGTGHFETGQAVEYRVNGKKLYIRQENNKEQKCKIESVKTEDAPVVSPAAH